MTLVFEVFPVIQIILEKIQAVGSQGDLVILDRSLVFLSASTIHSIGEFQRKRKRR